MSKVSSLLSISTVIKGMLLVGLIAIFVVIVQSCTEPESGIDRFGVKSLQKLTSLETPPLQPTIEFISAGTGDIKTLQDYRGQIVLVNAWATWCPPCVAEMPSLNRLQDLRGGDDFQVVTISLDNTKEKITEFFTQNDIPSVFCLHRQEQTRFERRSNAGGSPAYKAASPK